MFHIQVVIKDIEKIKTLVTQKYDDCSTCIYNLKISKKLKVIIFNKKIITSLISFFYITT